MKTEKDKVTIKIPRPLYQNLSQIIKGKHSIFKTSKKNLLKLLNAFLTMHILKNIKQMFFFLMDFIEVSRLFRKSQKKT